MIEASILSDILWNILEQLKTSDSEKEWIECKVNYANPHEIGEYISALSNSAALHKKEKAWIVWGIEDITWRPVGTSFKPSSKKIKPQRSSEEFAPMGENGEVFENWLIRQLSPNIDIRFYEFDYQNLPIVLLEIPAALHTPVSFHDNEYIRIQSYKKRLKDYPEKERNLWQILSRISFEKGTASKRKTDDQILGLLRYEAYFDLFKLHIPSERTQILNRLEEDSLIKREDTGRWSITNLGAILFARKLSEFETLKRKTLRIVIYHGLRRTGSKKEHEFDEGYAASFENVIEYIIEQIQIGEKYEGGFRQQVLKYPEITIRELIPNALIHQDFQISGAGPMVEIFDDRIEITNPGEPLIDTLRFIDIPPVSRNEDLAAFMRRLNICEERGSGIDKVIESVEKMILPPPTFIRYESNTKAILYAPKSFSDMDLEERIRACYQHACLCSVSNQIMTNTSLRDRFGLSESESSTVSRILSETSKARLIKLADPDNRSRRHTKYVPFWQ